MAVRRLITSCSSLMNALGSHLWTMVVLAFLLACDLVLFRNALVDGQIYSRSDTVIYYFPIADRLADVLREGRLMLWTRYIFGGFPLFADGEAGMLYPLNLLGYLLLPEQEAFIWLRVVRYFMAEVFTYGYLRVLGLNRLAATVGALTFAFGSFMVTQMHHTNVGNTAVWLPLTLCMVELAVRSLGRWRWLYATGAGATVGIQALGLHIQPLLMSGLFLAVYIPFRVMLCPIVRPVSTTKLLPAVPDRSQLAALARVLAERDVSAASAPRSGNPPWLPWSLGLKTWHLHRRASTATRFPRVLAAQARRCCMMLLGRWDLPSRKATLLLRRLWMRLPDAWLGGVAAWLSTAVAALGGGLRTSLRWTSRRARALPIGQAISSVLLHTGRFAASAFYRSTLSLLLLVMIPAIAFGVAAVQVIPLVELGYASFRGPGVSYQFATSYSMPLQNLINLLFPYFFRYTNRFYWSLWSEWETTLYVGIAPLVLAITAIVFVRSRMVLFFAAAAAASVLLALGSYAPFPLYEQLWQLPGFSSLRVPGRFGMLATFALAALAAFGLDWLCRRLRPGEVWLRPGRWERLSGAAGTNGFALFLAGLLAAIAGIGWWLVSFRIWIEKEPWAVKRLVEQSYLSLRNSRPWLTSDMVLSFLSYSLDPTNEKTATSLALMLATFLLLFLWFSFRRLWMAWASLLVLMVAADLLLFATDFHPTEHINQLSNPNSAERWLMAQNRDGMERCYTSPEVWKTQANRLLPFEVADIAGYSSLETTRHQQYMATMSQYDKVLLDLYGVRFVILPKRFAALPSYEYTAYHPYHPLAVGPRTNPGAHVTFYMSPPVRADEVSFISNLQDATGIPQDAEVAEIVVVDTSGERVTLRVRAGRDTAEWAYDRPDVTPNMAHQRARVADRLSVTDRDGRSYQANLYFGQLKLDKTRSVAKLEFHYIYPKGKVRLYGMMLWENPGVAHQVLERDRFIPRYEDDEVVILENMSRLPRALLVPTARVVKQSEVLDTMTQGDFDPEKEVLLESRDRPRPIPVPDTGVADPDVVGSWLEGNPDGRPGSAQIVGYGSTEVVIRTESSRNAVLFLSDSYYPGWKALVDGREERIYRADYLFRAVLVPKGTHEVRFVFEPESVALGADISVFTLSGLLLFWAIVLPGGGVYRAAWRAVRASVARRRRT